MRRLILMRHAKSSWAEAGQRDVERPLNARGRRAAAALGRWLAEAELAPERALVSSAVRARQSWEGLRETCGAGEAVMLDELYHAGPEAMLGVLRAAPDEARVLLMLGHQPGIGAFGRRLLAQAPQDAEFERWPTGGTAVIDFETADWRSADWGAGRLTDFVVPRALE